MQASAVFCQQPSRQKNKTELNYQKLSSENLRKLHRLIIITICCTLPGSWKTSNYTHQDHSCSLGGYAEKNISPYLGND